MLIALFVVVLVIIIAGIFVLWLNEMSDTECIDPQELWVMMDETLSEETKMEVLQQMRKEREK